jgi:glycosyltransferase involved in cell wall biosynthesis
MIMSVGRLNEAKGFPDLLEAFAQIHTEFPEAALVIVGGGTLLEELQAQVDAMGLQKKVILLGARSDARRLMATADIYVNSSHWEGTPVTVLEAMATGLPIIATRVGESPYLLAEDSGLLVSPYQPAEIAHALRHLLRDDTARKKLARTALERVRTHYSREAWRDSLLKLYAEEIDSARPQSKK